jgi:uncharacterized protein (TIGR03118 family)
LNDPALSLEAISLEFGGGKLMILDRFRVYRLLVAPLLAAALGVAVSMPSFAAQGFYFQANLVSDVPGLAATLDPNLVNPWGLARSATSPWWVSDNGTGKSTLYNGAGTKLALTVDVPGAPTGVVFNGTSGFEVAPGFPSRFIFASEDGTISGWNPAVDPNHAFVVFNEPTAVYKGLAIATTASGGSLLYATNFTESTVEVFDSTFAQVSLDGNFSDPTIAAGFAPFGIALLNGVLYVTYAKRDGQDDIAGPANGYVDVFDTSGHLLRRAATRGRLNSPWGVAIAPSNFGPFSGDLLVGNFGDGRINAVDPATGEFLGQLRDGDNRPITIDGLWAIAFGGGPGTNSGPTNSLFFTAGIEDEGHGLFGVLTSQT